MSPKSSSATLAGALLLIAVIAASLWYVRGPEPKPGQGLQKVAEREEGMNSVPASTVPNEDASPAPRVTPGSAPDRPAIAPLAPAPLADPSDRSPLADELNRPENTGVQDLEIVHGLFEAYRERFGAIPTGEDNASIVNALAGNNPRRLAFIDRTHPAINSNGAIVDRWGTPLFFHIEARDAWEIRSAGADREMYTADDLRKRSRVPRSESL